MVGAFLQVAGCRKKWPQAIQAIFSSFPSK
jgi:hypothetical protein